MSEQAIIKQKADLLGRMKHVKLIKAHETAMQAQKDESMRELAENIKDAYMEWQSALANFEVAEGKDMVDYYAYRIKASEIRYDYLIKKAKEAQAQ
jgi:hypothetical protein